MIISPTRLNQINFTKEGKEIILGASVSNIKAQAEAPSLSVITDAEFLADAYLTPNSPNLLLATNLVDYLASNRDEIIPIKSDSGNIFVFNASWQPVVVQWATTLGLPGLVGLLAGFRLCRRRRGFKRQYNL